MQGGQQNYDRFGYMTIFINFGVFPKRIKTINIGLFYTNYFNRKILRFFSRGICRLCSLYLLIHVQSDKNVV